VTAIAVVKAHVVRVHIVDVQVAVGVVVAVRLVVLRISQPPSAAVFSPPSPLLSSGALHGVLGAAATAVGGTSHVNNEVRLLRIVVDALLHRVVHDGPVVLVARRKDLVASGARVCFSAPPDPSTIMNPEDSIPGGIFGHADFGNFARGCAAGSARDSFFAVLGSVVVVPFRAVAAHGLAFHVRALARFGAAAVVFRTWIDGLLRGLHDR